MASIMAATRGASAMPRLFVGIELPEEVRDLISDLEAPLPGVRWIANDNLHLTLRFIGDIENRQARDLADFLSSVEVDAFEMRLDALGTFGNRDPRTLWAGVSAGPELDALARAAERAARAAGLKAESRNFKPHVTIARLNKPRIEALTRFLTRHGRFRSNPFVVSRFVLFSSKPLVGGGPYVVEEAYPLSGAAWEAYDQNSADGGNAW